MGSVLAICLQTHGGHKQSKHNEEARKRVLDRFPHEEFEKAMKKLPHLEHADLEVGSKLEVPAELQWD